MFNRVRGRGRLLDLMMEGLGVDARAAVGKSNGAAFAEARDNCCRCLAAETCRSWIDASPAGAAAPVFCPNRDYLREFMPRRA